MTSVHFVIVSSQEDLSYNFGKMTSNEVDQELTALRAFSEEKLRKGSVVYDKVQDLISQATRENARHAAAVLGVGKIASDGITLVLRFNNTNLRELKSIQVSPDATLAVVKQQIEAITGPAYCAERIQVRRTGKAFGQFDEKTIVQCEIKHNDELVVECKNINENFNPTGMERVTASGVTFSSEFQLICLALHAFMLDEGYVAVLELPNAVPGFAPSLKELPKGTFIANNWNEDPSGAVTIMYKHKLKPGKQFQLTGVNLGDSALVTLSMRGGDTHSLEVGMDRSAAPAQQRGTIALSLPAEELHAKLVSALIDKFLPARAAPVSTTATSTGSASSAMDVSTTAGGSSGAGAGVGLGAIAGSGAAGIGMGVGPQRGYVPGYGASDVDPFAGGVHIGGNNGGLYGPASSNPFGPGAGNQIGPDHPMFFPGGGYEDPYGGGCGGGYGAGLPQPRFDPYGPVLGPNTDIGGAGAGNVGVDGRGRRIGDPYLGGGRGGRGRGRGGPGIGGQYSAGEPNPDHLRPPGWH